MPPPDAAGAGEAEGAGAARAGAPSRTTFMRALLLRRSLRGPMPHFLDIHTTDPADLRAMIDQAREMADARRGARAARPTTRSRWRAGWWR